MRINVELTANTGSFETDFKRAAKAAEKRAKEIEKAFINVGKVIGTGIGIGVTAITALVKKSIDAAAELDDLSQKTGIAVESLSRLQYAAGLEGVEDLGASLAKLAKTISSDAELFKILGVNVTQANGSLRTTEDVLLDLADLFSKSADGTRKAAIAQQLFGKSGAALIPLLNKGSAGIKELYEEADRLGITISGTTSKAADDFNNNLFKLQGAVSGFANRLAENLTPELVRLTGLFVQTTKDADGMASTASGLATFFKSIALGAIVATNALQGLIRAFVAGHLAQKEFLSGNFSRAWDELGIGSKAIMGDVNDVKNAYSALFDEIEQGAAKVEKGGDGILPDVEAMKKAAEEAAKARKKAMEDAQKEAEKALKAALDAEEKQRESIRETIDALKEESATIGATNAQLAARKIEILGGTQAEKEAAYQLAQYIDLQKQAIEDDKERAEVLKETRTYAEVYADEIERLNRLFNNGTQDSAIYRRGVEAAQDAFDKAEKAAEEASNGMAVFADQAARNMQDAFADFLFDPFDQGLKGMVRSFAQTMQRMAAEALSANIFQSIVGAGGGGGLFSSLFGLGASFFSGGISSSGTYTAANIGRAGGGPVAGGTPYMVGEQGPELFIPNTTGSIVPSMQSKGMVAPVVKQRIVNAFDGAVVGDYLGTSEGEELLVNFVRRNGAKIRNVITNG